MESENASFPLGFEAILKGVRNTKGIQRKYAAREARRGEIWFPDAILVGIYFDPLTWGRCAYGILIKSIPGDQKIYAGEIYAIVIPGNQSNSPLKLYLKSGFPPAARFARRGIALGMGE